MSKKQEVNHDLIGDIALDLIENDWPNVGAQIQEYVQQNEKREATQTRWVKCSERMPEKAGEYLFVRISDGEVFQEVVWWDARPGMKYQMWDAWLENVPEIVP